MEFILRGSWSLSEGIKGIEELEMDKMGFIQIRNYSTFATEVFTNISFYNCAKMQV